MHRLGVRHAEVAVISDDLIRKAVCKPNANDDEIDPLNVNAIHEGGGADNQSLSASSNGGGSSGSSGSSGGAVDFAKLRVLSLSFRNIFKIDNLETLRHLTKLQLDNNVIQEIEGISHLVQLEWLDLSFNNITSIKGLETLTRLTDLSLYNNCITKLENLETLKKLQVLSIGNNSISNTDGLLYLKALEALRVLNLSGNPVCSDPEYRPFLLAHLDKLQYLDYALVDSNETLQAREQYQDELEELKEVKAIEDAALAREIEQHKYMAMLKDANVIVLETLLSDMFKEDTEMAKIEALPGLRNIIDDYTEKTKTATEDVKTVLLDKHAILSREVDTFHGKYGKIQGDAQDASIRFVENYRRAAKQLLKQARSGGAGGSSSSGSASPDAETIAAALQQLQEAEAASDKLHSELMNVESDLVETAQELIATMEISVDAVGAEARELATEHFRTVEVLENNFFESVSQLAVTLLERMASEDGEDDDFLSDECRAILNDRDALNNAINGSHDIHIGKLLAQEDVMREQSVAKIQELIKQAKSHEWTRNRTRVAEILTIREKHVAEIQRVRDELSHVDEEFY